MGMYLREQGQYAEAEASVRHALVLEEHLLGPQHLDTAQTLYVLGGVYFKQGKYQEAEPLLQRALAIREEHLGTTHPDTATSLNSLGELFRVQGKYLEAEPLYVRALAIREKALGPEHPDVATSLAGFIAFYTALLIVELYLMFKYARLGPSSLGTGRYDDESGTAVHGAHT